MPNHRLNVKVISSAAISVAAVLVAGTVWGVASTRPVAPKLNEEAADIASLSTFGQSMWRHLSECAGRPVSAHTIKDQVRAQAHIAGWTTISFSSEKATSFHFRVTRIGSTAGISITGEAAADVTYEWNGKRDLLQAAPQVCQLLLAAYEQHGVLP